MNFSEEREIMTDETATEELAECQIFWHLLGEIMILECCTNNLATIIYAPS